MRFAIILTTLTILTAPAVADSMDTAHDLGVVLAAEKFCALSYDQAAIARFIDLNVAADDLQFPGILSSMTRGGDYDQKSMSTSAKTAHCHQVERVAKTYGFTH